MAESKFVSELAHLRAAWRHFNAEFFDGRMKEPKFQVFGHKKFAGEWVAHKEKMPFLPPFHDGTGTLKMAAYLFEDEEKLKVTLLHEMCHQAVSTFHHRDETDKDGFHFPHGPKWREWAEKCGVADAISEVNEGKMRKRGSVIPKIGDFVFAKYFLAERNGPNSGTVSLIQGTCYVAGSFEDNIYVLSVDPKTNHLCLSSASLSDFSHPEKSEIPYLKQRIDSFFEDEKNKRLVAGAIKKSNSGQGNLSPTFFFDLETKSYCGFEITRMPSSGPRLA